MGSLALDVGERKPDLQWFGLCEGSLSQGWKVNEYWVSLPLCLF